MDQTTNPVERIFDLAIAQNNLGFNFQQEDSHPLDNLSFLGYNESKVHDRNQFFIQSPNPFKRQRKSSNQMRLDAKYHNLRSQQFFIGKKLNFDEQESMPKWFGNQKDSQIFCSESPFSPKKRDYFQFSCKQPKDLINEQISQVQFKSNKNQRGLKSLSQTVYEIVKRSQKTTFNIVAALLIEDIKEKAVKDSRELTDREQKNIKRRAYDALNVMIASQIIKKTDKFITLIKPVKTAPIYQNTSCNRTPNSKSCRTKSFKQIHYQIVQKLQQKQKIIELKKLQRQELQQRKQNIQKFFVHKKLNQYKPTKGQINFPFLCVGTDSKSFIGVSHGACLDRNSVWQKQNSSTCDQFSDENCIYLNFRAGQNFSNTKIEGDIDFVCQVGRQVQTAQNFSLSTQVQSLSLNN